MKYMPASPRSRTINLRVDLVPALQERWKKARDADPNTNHEFGGFVNDFLTDQLKKEKFMEQMFPHLHNEGHTGNTLFIYDSVKKERAEIYRYDNRIKCALCNSFDCEHIHFAFSLPEMAKLNIRKPPGR